MSVHRKSTILAVLVALLSLVSIASGASADPRWVASFTVPAGLSPDDLHVELNLNQGPPGGDVYNFVVKPAAEAVDIVGTSFNIEWTQALTEGTKVRVFFTATSSAVSFLQGWWTVGGVQVGEFIPIQDVNLYTVNIPISPPAPLMLLVLSLLAAGIWHLTGRVRVG
jgi:hypothetical protein